MTIGNWLDTALAGLPRTDAEERHRAARRVASGAVSATDAAHLLDLLGLHAQEGLRPAQTISA